MSIEEMNNEVAWKMCDFLEYGARQVEETGIGEICGGDVRREEMFYKQYIKTFEEMDGDGDDEMEMAEYIARGVHRLEASEYRGDAYMRDIKIREKRMGRWELGYEEYGAYEGFVCDDIEITAEGREIPQIGFFAERHRYPVIKEGGREWMAIKPSEIATMRGPIAKAWGHVVTFGLGMGYYAYMVSEKAEVTKVTIVEKDRDVIKLFGEEILPQFGQRAKIEIVESDAIAYMESGFEWDSVFVDLWHDAGDGRDIYKRIREIDRGGEWEYWIEKSLQSALRWQASHQNLF